MRAKTQIIFLTSLVGLAASLLFTVRLHAQTPGFSLTTSPLPINLTTTPGKPVSTELRVKNNSTDSQKLKVSLYKFSVNDQSEVQISEPAPSDEYIKWVSFNPQTFEAAPNEWRTIKMSIDVPKDAALGYYYAVGFSAADAPKATPGAATLQGQVITFVLLDVQVPGAQRELKVTSFKANRSTYEFLPVTFTVTVANTGNIHVVPSGNIFVTRGDKTFATLSINPGQGNILPNSSRTFTVEWKDGFPLYEPKTGPDGNPLINPKTNSVETQLKWDFSQASKLRFGPYSAKMVLVYDNGQRDVPIEGQVGFWVTALRVAAGLLVVLILAGIGLWSIGRKIFKTGKRLGSRKKEPKP